MPNWRITLSGVRSKGETNQFWVGANPGGRDSFGVAFLDNASGDICCRTVSSVDEAINCIIHREGEPRGIGIGAPMWWSSSEGGGRKADQRIRDQYPNARARVQSANSLQDAALVGGAMLAFRVREKYPKIKITESHPTALLSALFNDMGCFADRFGIAGEWEGDHPRHERDAVIAAICARQGFKKCWTTDFAENRYPSEQDPASYCLAPIHYFWPEALPRSD